MVPCRNKIISFQAWFHVKIKHRNAPKFFKIILFWHGTMVLASRLTVFEADTESVPYNICVWPCCFIVDFVCVVLLKLLPCCICYSSWIVRVSDRCVFVTRDKGFILWLEARLQPNVGNTLRPILMVFTRSGVTPPKVNWFWWNLEHIVWGWPWQIFLRFFLTVCSLYVVAHLSSVCL